MPNSPPLITADMNKLSYILRMNSTRTSAESAPAISDRNRVVFANSAYAAAVIRS